jgi:uncharacterized protein YbjT (DUF2867 family)
LNLLEKTAIILGATGLTGSLLLELLLEDARYNAIKVFTRTPLTFKHPRIVNFTGDLLALENFEKDFLADEVFCCIGTTAKKTPDKELYLKIDFGIPVKAAQLCKKNDIETFVVVSSLGADPHSSIFYSRTKGEMEEAVLAFKLRNTYILRPSLILGDRKEKRMAESIASSFFRIAGPLMIGPLKKYAPNKATDIAKAMLAVANDKPLKFFILAEEIEAATKHKF